MAAESWVDGATLTDFPLQNLPFGVFSHAPTARDPRIGVAIGANVLDMRALHDEGLLDEIGCSAVFSDATLNAFMARPRAERAEVRSHLTSLLAAGGSDARLRESTELQARCLVPLGEVVMHLPAVIGDYTDFYSSREHATNVGILFRGRDNALQPNWLHLPVGYHGRASSVVPSGTPVIRPMGQLQLDKADPTKGSEHAPCRLLDFELEMAFFVGGPPNAVGVPLAIEEAAERVFGFVLCNDWSARDVQKFEYVPLGPFCAKNFATTISPWVVMREALEPFGCPTSAGTQKEPTPLAYLRDPAYGSYNIELEVGLTPAGGASESVISRTNYRHLYWSCHQQLTHHSVTGCNMRAGDLLASGTISGSDADSHGSLLELSWQGTKQVGPLSDGSTRAFLKDGDTVTIRGGCRHEDGGYTIGFGECAGTVLPAGSVPPTPTPPPAAVAMREVTLLSYWRSSCSWRVRAALSFHGVPYTYESIDLLGHGHQERLDRVGRMAQLPRLDWSDAAGARHSLTQSLPIIELLEEAAGCSSGRRLLPSDAVSRARAREIAEVINAGTQPLQNRAHLETISAAGADGRAIGRAAIAKSLAALEELVSRNRDARFCVGAHSSIADVCLIPQLYNARRFEVDLQAFPRLLAVEEHASTLLFFQAAHPDRQPDAVAAVA